MPLIGWILLAVAIIFVTYATWFLAPLGDPETGAGSYARAEIWWPKALRVNHFR